MSLPKGNLPTRTVELSGGAVEIRGLTLKESQAAGKAGEGMIELAIMYATGESLDDVKLWLDEAPAGDAKKLADAIADLSGLTGAAQFQD